MISLLHKYSTSTHPCSFKVMHWEERCKHTQNKHARGEDERGVRRVDWKSKVIDFRTVLKLCLRREGTRERGRKRGRNKRDSLLSSSYTHLFLPFISLLVLPFTRALTVNLYSNNVPNATWALHHMGRENKEAGCREEKRLRNGELRDTTK